MSVFTLFLRKASSERMCLMGSVAMSCILSIFSLSGCAVNDFGLIHVQTHQTDQGTVRQTRALGLHVRTTGFDRGVSLGFARRAYFYPVDLDGKSVEQEPVGVFVQSLGLDGRLAAPTNGFNIGWREAAWLRPVPTDADLIVGIDIPRQDVAATRVTYRNFSK